MVITLKKQGGKAKDYIFSDYLKLGGKTFAQRHKELLHGGATQKEVQQLAKMQEKKAGRTPKVMQFGGTKQYQEGGENEGRNVLTMGMFSGPRNEEGQRTGDYVGSTSVVTETPGEMVVQGEEGSALRRGEVEAWSQDRKQEKTGDNLYAGVTEEGTSSGAGSKRVRSLQLEVNKQMFTKLYDQKMQLATTEESFGSSDRLFDAKIPLKQKTKFFDTHAASFESNQLVFVVYTVDPTCQDTLVSLTDAQGNLQSDKGIALEFESKYSYKDF